MPHTKEIVCWVPFDKDGNAMLEKIKPGDFKIDKSGIQELPFPIDDKDRLIEVKPLTVLKVNGKYCWYFVQGGVLAYY